ncbi:MAG: hypothetical protein J6Y21_01900 [Clostridia bacterium]|nr:hypothetical protein [Clostridia bacterium]
MKTFVKKTDKRSRTVLAAVIAAVCAVIFLCSFAASSNVIAAGLIELEEGEGEWDVFETKLPETTAAGNADASGGTPANGSDEDPSSDPDATPLPTTERGEHILFEGTDEGGSGKTSAGSVIMIIIVVAALLSVVSGIVEKIVKYYKNRDKNYNVD